MHITGSFPISITESLVECKAFYETYFAFTVVFEADWYIHLVHQPSGTQIGFLKPGLANQPALLHPRFAGEGMVFSLETDDATIAYRQLKAQGLNFALELQDEDWGQRHCIIRDPSGVYVDIVQQL